MKHITPEGIEVKVGQKWRDLDKRMALRTVIVEEINGSRAKVRHVYGGKATFISIRRMVQNSTGWSLFAAAPTKSEPDKCGK